MQMAKRLQVSSGFFTTVPLCTSCVLLVAGNGFHSIRGCVMGIWICDGTEHCEILIQPRFDLRSDVCTSCSWCSDVVEGIWIVFTRIRGLLLLLASSIEWAPHGVHQSGRECKWIHLVSLTICWAWGILALSFPMHSWRERLKESDLLVDKLSPWRGVVFCQDKLAQAGSCRPPCEDSRLSPQMLTVTSLAKNIKLLASSPKPETIEWALLLSPISWKRSSLDL